MDVSRSQPWIRATILLGVVYFVFGIAFAALASRAGSHSMAVTWNRSGFVVSAVAFVAHIAYERLRLRNSSFITAWHTALAVALGAFLLALAAILHALRSPSHAPYWLHLVALVLWPLITGLPAWLVALAVAAVLAQLAKQRLAG